MARKFPRGLELAANKDAALASPLRAAPAPAMAVHALDQGSGHEARAIVQAGDRVRLGTCIAATDEPGATSVHSSVSGTVLAVEMRPTAAGPRTCVVVGNDGLDEREVEPAPIAWEAMDPAALVAALGSSGVAGLGGAAFAAATKLGAARRLRAAHLVLNGAECEPWICCDDALMRERAADLILGARVMLRATGATRCTVAVEDDKPQAIAAVQAALAQAQDPRFTLATLAACYPAGAERQLLAAVTGVEVPHDSLPPAAGLLCQNVGTAAAVADAVRGLPVTSRIVTVTGSGICAPSNLVVRVGTPVADLVAACGGYRDVPIRLVAGGSMTGRALETDEPAVTLAMNCLLVATAGDLVERGPEHACIRCGDCARVCPPGLLPQQLLRGVLAGDAGTLERHGLADCIECGCCDYVCPSAIPLTARFRAARAEARAREAARIRADESRERHIRHQQRLSAAAGAERRAFESARERARGGQQ